MANKKPRSELATKIKLPGRNRTFYMADEPYELVQFFIDNLTGNIPIWTIITYCVEAILEPLKEDLEAALEESNGNVIYNINNYFNEVHEKYGKTKTK